MSPVYHISSIAALMAQLEQPASFHPLVALMNYSDVKIPLAEGGSRFSLGFYKISFKTSFRGKVKYGPGYYDFQEGGLAFLAPDQVVTMSEDSASYEGFSLYFHADLIRGYPLGNHIHQFGFFSYAVSEALFLSGKEKRIIAALFETIAAELDNNIDQFSQDVLVSQLELLLNYSNRYYHRQFLTRKPVYNDVIASLDRYLNERFNRQHALNGIPTVAEASQYLKLSPRYLTDMLKSLTGQNTQQYIHTRLIEKAKDVLANSRLTIAEIAYELGFEHPQSFNRLFKQKTKLSPVEFRQSFQ